LAQELRVFDRWSPHCPQRILVATATQMHLPQLTERRAGRQWISNCAWLYFDLKLFGRVQVQRQPNTRTTREGKPGKVSIEYAGETCRFGSVV